MEKDFCINCEAFQGLEVTVKEAYLNAFPIMATGLSGILTGLITILLLFLIFKMIMGTSGEAGPGTFVTQLLIFSIVFGMLQGNGGMFWPVYEFIVAIGPWVGIHLVEATGGNTGGYTGFAGLIYIADNSVLNVVFRTLLNQTEDISITAKLSQVFGIGILFIVYLTLSWKLTKAFLIGFFEATAVAIMAPFLIIFIAFQQTRPLTFGALRVLMASTAKMILGAVTIVVVLMLMDKVMVLFQEALPMEGLNVIWGTQFMVALFTGFMMVLATSIFE